MVLWEANWPSAMQKEIKRLTWHGRNPRGEKPTPGGFGSLEGNTDQRQGRSVVSGDGSAHHHTPCREENRVKTLGFNKTNTNPLRGDSHNTPDPTGGACRHVCLPASTQVPDSQERTGAALRAPCLAQVWSQTVNTAVGRLQVPGVPSKFVEETMRKFYLTFLSGRMRKQAYYLIILVRVLSSLEKRF